jgi:tRNA G18 (ribose-2'-O)-methylase SpoU
MSKIKPASGITISFTRDEIEWLHWIMTHVLKRAFVDNTSKETSKEKIITAYDLLVATDEAKDNQNMGAS